ncbi:inhibitor of nuclear factor kappa-B kinase subunit beta [Octopus bimaculoides]|uniref:IkappaB kinase n=1 Tax=Octopus bimaculoides TaxID=37653 RepID=A0A0L8IGX6_OCTBM|nr:inhibitor of nuclear factor kappa-B kinase subunit beta [Octopus bimaculoides]|eukprot:XP_014769161.1 PREDICTED: inhibitor of nuclear factor kappa-B kinase subunit beta-like [Octopus bimaculoides]
MPAVEMEGNQETENSWKNVKTIGKGTFGFVELWVNEETLEELALKQIQIAQECKPNIVSMWKKEIEIMKKLDHRNIIRVRDTPAELKQLERVYPILAMEYCSLGNLRKDLSRSYCGFSEANVLHFTKDISAAVAYLHTQQIVHRDIKPENIVLKEIDNKVVYKLIDLGYAKDLNQGSVCKSFVGTLIYVAPELYRKEQYTHTADYWSLGTVIFEIITGYQPFLPTYSPVKWYEEVNKKKDDHISVQCMPDRSIHFSSELPKCIKLCSPLKQSFEKWLKTMLLWDADARGNDSKEKSSKQWCFQQLEKILESQILRIYHVTKNNLLCYMLEPDQRIDAIQNIISMEADVPSNEQIIIKGDGQIIDRRQFAKDFLSDNDEVSLFLLDKRNLNGKPDYNTHTKYPEQLQVILGNANNKLNNYEPKRLFAETLYFCKNLEEKSRRLIQSVAACRKSLAIDNKQFLSDKARPCDIKPQIYRKADIRSKSLQLNKRKFKSLKLKPPETYNDVIDGWSKMISELEEIKSFVRQSEATEEVDFSSNKSTSFNERYETLKNIVEDLNELYTSMNFTEATVGTVQEDVKDLVENCIAEWEALFEECHSYRISLNSSWVSFFNTSKQLQEKNNRIESLREEEISYFWKLIEAVVPKDEQSMCSPIQECTPSFSSITNSLKLINDNKLLHDDFEMLVADFPAFPDLSFN